MLCNVLARPQCAHVVGATQLGQWIRKFGHSFSGAHTNTHGRRTRFNASLGSISLSPSLSRRALTSIAALKGLAGATQGLPRKLRRPLAMSRVIPSIYPETSPMESFGSDAQELVEEFVACVRRCRRNTSANEFRWALALVAVCLASALLCEERFRIALFTRGVEVAISLARGILGR